MAALTIRSFLKLCTYLNPSSQFFSQCIPSSPGLGLASADLAARNENRRGKLWKGLVICLHTFYLQKGKAKAPEHGGQQCAGGKALRLTPAQQELNSPIWGRLTQHLSRWGCRGSKPCLLPPQMVDRARLSMGRRHQALQAVVLLSRDCLPLVYHLVR